MSRRQEVIDLLAVGRRPFDDDEIAERLGMNRHYVNQICRRLAAEGRVERSLGQNSKFVNELTDTDLPPTAADHEKVKRVVAPLRRADTRQRANIEALIGDFDACVSRFESSSAFPGPSLYFHERALAQRGLHSNATDLLNDQTFLEYVYAVLPAWGMHRMGNQAAKVVDFPDMADSLRSAATPINGLWSTRITDVRAEEAESLAQDVWRIIASLRVSRSETRIVAGSKALHHVLPDLVPPIDRQYTFRLFTGQKAVNRGDERAFLVWFPLLCEIGRRCRADIEAALERGGVMATSRSKVIDNAIIGFMQRADRGIRDADP